jgi:hypothetical protein
MAKREKWSILPDEFVHGSELFCPKGGNPIWLGYHTAYTPKECNALSRRIACLLNKDDARKASKKKAKVKK